MTDCIFCKIISKEIPSKKVYEDNHNFAFLDINPRNPGHTLVMPKVHSETIFSMSEENAAELMKALRKVAIAVRKATGAKGISVSQSNGELAGQRMPHVHFHIIPRTEAEKGHGLEEVIAAKKADEASLNKMASSVAKAIPKEAPKPKPRPAPQTEPREEAQKQESKPEPPKNLKEPDKQKIDFDF